MHANEEELLGIQFEKDYQLTELLRIDDSLFLHWITNSRRRILVGDLRITVLFKSILYPVFIPCKRT